MQEARKAELIFSESELKTWDLHFLHFLHFIEKDLEMQRQTKINDSTRRFGVFMTPQTL